MTHKNSILELILRYLPKNIVIGQMLTDVQKKNVTCDDTFPGYHRHPRPILVFPQKICRKAAIRPIVPIDL
jgi:hypothetical protein